MPFAPVTSISVDVVCNPHGVTASGWAAPKSGRLPCALQLVAGSDVLALAPATRYSAAAAQRGYRLGWCGFRIGDLSAAAALDDEIRLVCVASGEVQRRWTAGDVVQRAAPAPRPHQTVPEFRKALQRASGCENVDTILPFARRLQRMQGDIALIVACYRWMLRRSPALSEAQDAVRSITSGDMAQTAIEGFRTSDEYRLYPHVPTGPFEGAFPFDLGAFDDA